MAHDDSRITAVPWRAVLIGAALGVGALFLLCGAPGYLAVVGAVAYAPLILNAYIDLLTSRLVKALTNISAVVVLGVTVVLGWDDPQRAGVAIAFSALLAGIVAIISKASNGRLIGLGDARLLFPLGMVHALSGLTWVLWWLWLATAVHVVVILAYYGLGARRDSHPFGPSLIMASLACSAVTLVTQ